MRQAWPVEFTFDPFFSVVFRRPVPERVQTTFDEALISVNFTRILMRGGVEGVNEGVKARLVGELSYVLQNGSATRQMLQKLFRISPATAERDISFLRVLGIITFEGAPKKGRYVLTEKGRSELLMMEGLSAAALTSTMFAPANAGASPKLTRDEIEKIVGPELEHIPRGSRGSSQNMLRMLYNMLRRHNLALPGTPQTKEAVLREAINAVREEDPDFTPDYDKDLFKC